MATLMITGGKLGTILGRRRAFRLGLIIYAAGSLTTPLAPNLTVLLIGWSLLEGLGASVTMPAIVALVAANFVPERRAGAFGLVAAAGARPTSSRRERPGRCRRPGFSRSRLGPSTQLTGIRTRQPSTTRATRDPDDNAAMSSQRSSPIVSDPVTPEG